MRFVLPPTLPLALGLSLLPGCGGGETPAPAVPRTVNAEYVSDASCVACHEEEARLWGGSHHDLAMQPATAETVLGDFDEARFVSSDEDGPRVTRFFRDGERFLVHTLGPDGEPGDFEVAYTFGAEPLQQYLIELDRGRVQCLTIAWDTQAGEWFDLYAGEEIPPGDALHWTGRYQRWNTMCAACHSTDLRREYDVEQDAYATTWKEIDVGCQACHGAGGAHVAWSEQEEATRDDEHGYGLVTQLTRTDATPQVNACAPCHSRRTRLLDVDPGPDHPFLDRYLPERLHQGYYHADGQILEEVYVYGSYAQSKMGMRGVTCTDCHEPHSLELRGEDNAVCTACHSLDPPLSRFPTLQTKLYDDSSHHHHPEGSEGARCVTCHMPERTYMVVDPRRDHSFRIPRPDLSGLIGTPNACTQCHDDLTDEEAAASIESWYGPERPLHFAPIFAAGRFSVPEAEQPLTAIAMDPESPGIVRATALELLRPYGNSAAPILVQAVRDEDALVRTSAVGGLDGLPAQARVALAAPLLRDPVRSVRIEAARVLADVGGELDAQDASALAAATEEFIAAQEAQSDMPSAHLNLGILHGARGNSALSEAAYRLALEQDPAFLPAAFNLSNLLNRMGRNEAALTVLEQAVLGSPEEGELHFSLALLLAEMGRLQDSVKAMKRASTLIPDRPRLLYNLGILYRELGRFLEAESTLMRACERFPEDPDPLHALVRLYIDRKEWQNALPFAEKLARLLPRDPTVRELLEEVRRGG